MLASDVITLGAAIVGLLTSIAGSSACFYNSYRTSKINLSILKVKVHNLEILIGELQNRLNGIDILNPDPSSWISQARDFLRKVNVSDLENRLNDNCVSGHLPNFYYRCTAEKCIEGKIQELDVFLENGNELFQEIKIIGSKQPEVNIIGSAREEMQQSIWDHISQPEASGIICIHGITGVGKTVMAAAIHNKALVQLKAFEVVIWVKVEYGSGLRHVQEEIASKLEVDLSDINDTLERSKALRSALMQRGKFLLVLDSMWQAFALHDIGIPELDGGSKLIVTSRTCSICRKMTRKIKRREIYEIEPLSEDDAWELLMGELGPNTTQLESETLHMARDVMNNLDGLPMAIKILAETLNEINDDYWGGIETAWKEELSALCRSTSILGNKSQELFECFKYSYENLGGVAMSCFLYCALFPKGYIMKANDLIDYWMWEGLLGPISSLEESMRLGRRTLNECKDAHLLKTVDKNSGEESMKMLNLVRHVAMDAVSKSSNQFIKCGDSLGEFPPAYDWPTETEKASFVQNQLKSLQNSPDCKKLTTLLLQDNHLNMPHHENFFTKLRNLRVLNLSHTNISSFPKSFSALTNLCALLLHSCLKLKRLPSLSNLHKLIVIDLSETPLEQVPEGLQSLSNLRRLNLSQTRIEVFPAKVIGKLTQVEELLLIAAENGGYVWGSNKEFPQWPGACVEELADLKRLAVLQLTFLSRKVFNRYVDEIDAHRTFQLHSFKFCVGGIYNVADIGDNSIVVIGDCSIRLPERTFELHLMMCSQEIFSLKFDGCLRDLTILDVSYYDELTYLFTLGMLGSLKRLKKICVKRCKKMRCIIQPAVEANPTSITLLELTTFVLFDLPNLESIFHGEVLNCPSLRGLEVWNCDSLKLPKVLLGRNIGIVEIKGEKKWLEKVIEESPSTNSTLKYSEASVPTAISTPSFRLRRPESFVSSSDIHKSSFRKFAGLSSVPQLISPVNRTGITVPRENSTSASPWNKFVVMFKGGRAFSEATGSLHIGSGNSDAISEDSSAPHSEIGLSQSGLQRSSSTRADS